MSPEITLIKKCGLNPVMSKNIFLDHQGELRSDGSKCLMVDGTATRAMPGTARAMADYIGTCGSDQAIALGSLRTELPDTVTITVPSRLRGLFYLEVRRMSGSQVLPTFAERRVASVLRGISGTTWET